MITEMFVIGSVVKKHKLVPAAQFPPVCFGMTDSLVCNFYAYVDVNVNQRYGLKDTSYIPDDASRTVPQWFDPWYHHGLIQGYVSDQNAYALGGISGHAGVFSTATDMLRFIEVWINAEDPEYLDRATVALFTKIHNATQSSRALGWDTNANKMKWCGALSDRTFFHIGFTGTEFCADPVNGVVTVLLANGRYPNYHVDGLIKMRPKFNDLALSVVQQLRSD
jgi:CubicO group peptidase (beta-lactamase class C family)